MFFLAAMIAKERLKSTDFSMVFLVTLALFLWLGSRVQKFLPDGYFWAMNMGVVFCSIMSAMILISVFWILLGRNKQGI
ncbi:hypothetical protein Q5I06_06745 [Helicobacter sp. faydin-H76]|nr:hypothetical protein [Helicobacter sp. faydin-H76]MDP2539469.1 hypothetical protein [Helicobacter sp. faydin-H76]